MLMTVGLIVVLVLIVLLGFWLVDEIVKNGKLKQQLARTVASRDALRRYSDQLVEVNSEFRRIARESQQAAAYHEQRQRYFVDLFNALWVLVEVVDERKVDEIKTLGIQTPRGWIPSKEGLTAIEMHLGNCVDAARAGKLAITDLAKWEEENPPPTYAERPIPPLPQDPVTVNAGPVLGFKAAADEQ